MNWKLNLKAYTMFASANKAPTTTSKLKYI